LKTLIITMLLSAIFTCAAIAVPDAPAFKVGIEMPSQVPVTASVEAALKEMGISYINFYINTSIKPENSPDMPAKEVNNAMMDLADRLKLDYSISCHISDPPDECVRDAVAHGKDSGRFRGVVFDELEHIRLLQYGIYGTKDYVPIADPDKFKSLDQAYTESVAGFKKLKDKFAALGCDKVVSTHIWPVLHHVSARAGFDVCPKICKELYSPVSLAIGLGAAKQYGRSLWVDIDQWLYDLIPGHGADEFKSNLMMAYWLGADVVYAEGCGYNLYPAGKQGIPFSMMTQITATDYQLTSLGETLRWFCKEYVPSHPRPWTFRDIKPSVAIIRFEDSCHGQRYIDPKDCLYGSPNLHSDADTEAWLPLWNLLTFGKTGRDGLTYFKVPFAAYGYQGSTITGSPRSAATRPLLAETHMFFSPLNGVVVYDHLVGYDLLKGIPLLAVTGKEISPDTMAAVRKCVQEGAVCLFWAPLAKKNGFKYGKEPVVVIPEGKGRFVLTNDFQLPSAWSEVAGLIGKPDEIRYQFGDKTVTLKRITDNEVAVDIDGVKQ
jgi:hypothetical protein